MLLNRIYDWDDAYANFPNIPQGERWPEAWVAPSHRFVETHSADGEVRLDVRYGDKPRNLLDLFLPHDSPRGLVVFVHGGFWYRLHKDLWSHLAKGPLDHGYAVAIPSYSLCPNVRIADITAEVGAAIELAAGMVQGGIRLAGHSAGGHLVSRMSSASSPLSSGVAERIEHVLSISGLHDLRPLMKTKLNDILRIDVEEAQTESPSLLEPLPATRLTCWVGASERSEFLRQNALLANIWKGLGAATATVEEPDRHHFNILDRLVDPSSAITGTLMNV